MKRPLRILPYLTMATLVIACQQPIDTSPQGGLWIAVSVSKAGSGQVFADNKNLRGEGVFWATKQQCLAAQLDEAAVK